MVVLFTEEFIVTNDSRGIQNYLDLIRRLRERLAATYSHNTPVLPLQKNYPEIPTDFFEIVVRFNTYSVTFRFRADNLYLIGFQMTTPQQWVELDNYVPDGKKKKKLFHLMNEPGTSWLGCEGSYNALAGASKQIFNTHKINSYTLQEAIRTLTDSTNAVARASGLISVIVMICEATRLKPVLKSIAENFNVDSTAPAARIPDWMIELVRSWENFSDFVLRADAFPDVDFCLPSGNIVRVPPDNTEIRNVFDVVQILGIMLGFCYTTKRHSAVVSCCGKGMCYLGTPMLQIFSVRINNIDGENPGQLYGTIKVNDGLLNQDIYNRARDNYESIQPGQDATLTGPNYPIAALGQLTIDLLLTDKDSISSDDIIIDDSIYWNCFNMANLYDQLISQELSSYRGSVTVNYATLQNAVSAEVIIILEEGGERWCEVYGNASVAYNLDNDPSDATTCLLFQRSSSDYVEVRRWQQIPLLRHILAVPLDNNYSPKLTVDFWDYDPVSSDDQIAQGTIALSAPDDIPGTTFQKINGVCVTTYWRFAI